MKELKDILYKVRIGAVKGSTDLAVSSICFDSRKVEEGSLFVAVRGTQVDGHEYIAKAVSAGATSIMCEEFPSEILKTITYIEVSNTAEALAFCAANFYNNPSERLELVAVTGTNGKTTTVTLLHSLLSRLGYKVGMLSTVVNKIGNEKIEATHTTPDAVELNRLLSRMVTSGCTHCFIEASSHAIVQHRISGLHFAGAAFTNLSHEHLDYHKTFQEYINAKKKLFDGLSPNAFALVNKDDAHGMVMLQNTKARKKTYALRSMAHYRARIIENLLGGLHLQIDGNDLYSRLVGAFNAYNILASYAICIELGLDAIDVLTQLSTLESVEGRFQYIKTERNITAIVDYAHTPDALKNVLQTIKDIRTGNEKVITVVGCGGDRDREKRPQMAKIAVAFSDKVILTSDNPRSEDPQAILDEMKAGLDPIGVRKSLSLPDRREAINLACGLAESGDIILIAGKGHEKYQEIKGEKYPFDDFEIVNEALKTLEK